MIKKIAIYGSDNGRVTTSCVSELVDVLVKLKIEVWVNQNILQKIDQGLSAKVDSYITIDQIKVPPDMVLSVGGDGTFLEAVSQVRNSGIPVAGVNTGRLGFLSNIHDNIEFSVIKIIGGEYRIVERSLLELVEPKEVMGRTNVALNDITIQKADLNMITIRVHVDNTYLNTYWADGLIISTATGSTAYNLSTGGPILSPSDDSIIISPLSPHNLTVRPIVLPGNSKLKLSMEGRSPEYLVTCDFRSARLPFSDDLIIQQPKFKIRTVSVEGQDFFRTLRDKLMWGADPRN
jgi:NAD+ kinase